MACCRWKLTPTIKNPRHTYWSSFTFSKPLTNVRLGIRDLKEEKKDLTESEKLVAAQDFDIENMIAHEQFKMSSGLNNIGLIKWATFLGISQIRKYIVFNVCLLTGWRNPRWLWITLGQFAWCYPNRLTTAKSRRTSASLSLAWENRPWVRGQGRNI